LLAASTLHPLDARVRTVILDVALYLTQDASIAAASTPACDNMEAQKVRHHVATHGRCGRQAVIAQDVFDKVSVDVLLTAKLIAHDDPGDTKPSAERLGDEPDSRIHQECGITRLDSAIENQWKRVDHATQRRDHPSPAGMSAQLECRHTGNRPTNVSAPVG
jgi:hypothetical protein